MTDPLITIRLPRSHWRQIVNDIANMCGTDDVEILSHIEDLTTYTPCGRTSCTHIECQIGDGQ